jgi:hypothetical protein
MGITGEFFVLFLFFGEDEILIHFCIIFVYLFYYSF